MAQRAIREFDAKKIMELLWKDYFGDDMVFAGKSAQVEPCTDWDQLKRENPWLEKEKLVVKPDQLIGKRGKQGLILLNAHFKAVKEWVLERMGKPMTLGKVTGVLTHFVIEPSCPSALSTTSQSNRTGQEKRSIFLPRGGWTSKRTGTRWSRFTYLWGRASRTWT